MNSDKLEQLPDQGLELFNETMSFSKPAKRALAENYNKILSIEMNEKADPKFRRWWRSGFFIFAFFTLLALLNLPDIYFYYLQKVSPTSLFAALGRLALTNYLWTVITPLIFLVGDAFPVGGAKLVKNLGVHIVLGIFFGAFYTCAFHLIMGLFDGLSLAEIGTQIIHPLPGFMHNVKNGFIFYAGIQTFNQAAEYSRKYREREVSLAQAELKALKSQLNPHFLFNTLNAISALVHRSPEDADRTITQLSDLLRISLESGKAEEIPLEEELDFLRAYLQIHKTLMGDRLEVEWQISPAAFDAAVPKMILQPLVENAVEHGLAPLKKGGRVRIEAFRENETLHLVVQDNGCGLAQEKADFPAGIGLSNTRARLRFLYGETQKFELADGAGTGLKVSIEIPFRVLKEV